MDNSEASSSESEEELNARGDALEAKVNYLKKYNEHQEQRCARVSREIAQMKRNLATVLKAKYEEYEEERQKSQPLDLSKVTSTKNQWILYLFIEIKYTPSCFVSFNTPKLVLQLG